MASQSLNNATQDWVRIRKQLFLQVKAEVMKLLGDSQREFDFLEQAYEKELTSPWRAVKKDDFYKNLNETDIILMGDFHALQQSQRSHLRVLRDWPGGAPPLVIAAEFFQARHQKWIDSFLKGTISERTFLEKVHWQNSWGFPWEHYRPLIDWAKKNKVRVFGINWGLTQKSIKSIQLRDHFSAMCIEKIYKRNRDKKIFVIYGDLHIQDKQLPKALRRRPLLQNLNLIKVFQNYEPLYFKLLLLGIESQVDLIQFRNGSFCLQSVPPWVKWQSYLLFLESAFDRELEDPELDHTDHVAKLVQFLSLELKYGIKGSSLAVYTANDTFIYSRLKECLNSKEWTIVKRWILDQRSFYLPQIEVGYLGRVSVNHTASLASEFVHARMSKRSQLFLNGMADFERQIWIQAMTYLGSKVINHRRKTSTMDDLKNALLSGSVDKSHRKVLILTLQQRVREITYLSNKKVSRIRQKELTPSTIFEASRLLGAMLGERIYVAYRQGIWDRKKIRYFLQQPLEGEQFQEFYYKAVLSVSTLSAVPDGVGGSDQRPE